MKGCEGLFAKPMSQCSEIISLSLSVLMRRLSHFLVPIDCIFNAMNQSIDSVVSISNMYVYNPRYKLTKRKLDCSMFNVP